MGKYLPQEPAVTWEISFRVRAPVAWNWDRTRLAPFKPPIGAVHTHPSVYQAVGTQVERHRRPGSWKQVTNSTQYLCHSTLYPLMGKS